MLESYATWDECNFTMDGNYSGMDAEESAQKVKPGEENSPTTPDGT